MRNDQKIHILSQELIPMIDEIEEGSRQIILDHISECEECQRLYRKVKDINDAFPTKSHSDEFEIAPLKSLVKFKLGLFIFLVLIRFSILYFIIYSGATLVSEKMQSLSLIQSYNYLFYLPVSLFLIVFTFMFFKKRIFFYFLIFDVFIILFLDNIIQLFL